MGANGTGLRLEETARGLFDVMTHFALTGPRGRRRAGDLKDVEFLSLALLHQHGTLIVGDIQRQLGVLPAQMSRIIRALESRDRPFILCRINSHDKRKIDVSLTPAGEKALVEYQGRRVQAITDVLRRLPEEEQEELARMAHRLLVAVEHPSVPPCEVTQ
jgi:DNA-binding MarR family transcriptional regulator